MKNSLGKYCASRGIAILLAVCLSSVAAWAGSQHYIVTNDDNTGNFIPNSMTFYSVGANGQLTLAKQVQIGVTGIAGGYFPSKRVAVLDNDSNQCIFGSDAATGTIAGVDSTLTLRSSVNGSSADTGLSNGVGLALGTQYLYAGFTDSSNIGTFQIGSDCALTFVGDVTVGGLQGGVIDAMAVHGNLLIATYGDGSMESFNVEDGMPVSNGDKQNSSAAIQSAGASYPSAIDITQDGHYAIFGDTSTDLLIEVSDISSGLLTTTKTYKTSLTINSSNIMLSPDETLLYVVDTQGDRVSAGFFDKTTGAVTRGCATGFIKGYSQNWSYLAGIALANNTGNGGDIYVAEFGAPSSIAMVQVTSSAGQCSLAEIAGSPVADPNSPGLLSIASFPPRSF